MNSSSLPLHLLHNWAKYSQHYWTSWPELPGSGFYGTGFNSWGVQTNQKYFTALALLASHPNSPADRQWAREQALAALRFSLSSHKSGQGRCSDDTQWGHTWISALGLERMMCGVHALREELAEADREALRRLLCSEADYLLHRYSRGKWQEITGNVWNDTGQNAPESNLWNGALLWRTAVSYPDHPHCDDWKERAHRFLINAVSVAGDETDDAVIAGKPVRERFVGANFFPNYALDHHGYLNVGYMVICTSNAAMLHFDLKAAGLERPESLDRHQADLWQVIRRMIFPNGRLARIGGDTRVRYTYCQEYLLPSLLYAADHLDESHAAGLIEAQVQLIAQEADDNGNGSFYGKRLAELQNENPYYFTRLESDRACALAMLLAYQPLAAQPASPGTAFETTVSGGWHEDEHGAALHRCGTRFASFAWRSYGRTQGLCLPPHESHLAEWQQNLSSTLRFMGDDGDAATQRKVLHHTVETFDGGFLTWGEVAEGMNLKVAEGWLGSDTARHFIAFAALPDGHTVAGIEFIRNADKLSVQQELKGLHLAFANDFYNGHQRQLTSATGDRVLRTPAAAAQMISLGGNWACIEDHISAIGVYGAAELTLHRSPGRRGGKFHSLFTEEICYPCAQENRTLMPGETILDIGWLALSSVNAAQTEKTARAVSSFSTGEVRALRVPGQDGKTYTVVFNFGPELFEAGALDWGLPASSTVPAGKAQIFMLP